ncbi:endolytic transglycosylase MltG [Modestobacter sp. SSW1-42]|uniref:endolytic transglycosylase MltG n=1 Tax=Modestobacter sp. SSW1-42 TaxID=596372 RepID=UPI0039889370
MTDPTQPRSRGRHSSADSDAGRSAADLLAAWNGASTTQLTDDASRRPRRRRAPETAGTGVQVLPARSDGDTAGGLDATGMADVGLAAAGLDVSSLGIGRSVAERRPLPPAPAPARSAVGFARAAAPRTTEMSAAPAVPSLAPGDPTGAVPVGGRRVVPAPRPATERDDADRAGRTPARDGAPAPQHTVAGAASLAALFAETHPTGAHPRQRFDDLATQAHPVPAGDLWGHDPYADQPDEHDPHDDWSPAEQRHHEPGGHPDAHDDDHDDHEHAGPATVFDETGGLEVIAGDHHDDHHDDHGGHSGGRGRGGGRGGRGGSGSGRPRRRRRGPVIVVLSLLVLVGIVAGAVVGGRTLWNTLNPMAEDYTGAGTGAVEVRVNDGDSLRTIGATLVAADVIASPGPFEDAAAANPAAAGIQPGVYSLRAQMSGQAALDLLLDPTSRMVSRVTIPEGMTVTAVLQRLADGSKIPLADFQAAAADPAQLGLPAYANGLLEGFLFPATYDIEPGQTAAQVLSQMVARTDQVLTGLQIPVDQRLRVLTEASIVQAEAGSVEDMGKVARVLDNRIAQGMRLQLDTTVNYANGKSGVTTTPEDRANPSPYNTYANDGLPPGAISNPGEEAIQATLDPTPGDWLFFVVTNPDTGETRFANTGEEHQANVLLFQQWLRDNPGN